MPRTTRRSKFSWKRNHAMSTVATPSSVSKSDAVAASVRVSPTRSSTGPTTPPAMMAPESQGRSLCLNVISPIPGGESIGTYEATDKGYANSRAAIEQPREDRGVRRAKKRFRRRCRNAEQDSGQEGVEDGASSHEGSEPVLSGQNGAGLNKSSYGRAS